ncbi:hypothetical protein B0J11DRAFT_566885 [Dendryphion nanum]|uniref:Uncharacterized protein n=1 Tax=Dendryphion nanum TaxID=256645 RepID=A0A9P9IPI3_9PLEO|nr:hypothetical protein B0J11DRAFT_566885 [Dendryphion nanum]
MGALTIKVRDFQTGNDVLTAQHTQVREYTTLLRRILEALELSPFLYNAHIHRSRTSGCVEGNTMTQEDWEDEDWAEIVTAGRVSIYVHVVESFRPELAPGVRSATVGVATGRATRGPTHPPPGRYTPPAQHTMATQAMAPKRPAVGRWTPEEGRVRYMRRMEGNKQASNDPGQSLRDVHTSNTGHCVYAPGANIPHDGGRDVDTGSHKHSQSVTNPRPTEPSSDTGRGEETEGTGITKPPRGTSSPLFEPLDGWVESPTLKDTDLTHEPSTKSPEPRQQNTEPVARPRGLGTFMGSGRAVSIFGSRRYEANVSSKQMAGTSGNVAVTDAQPRRIAQQLSRNSNHNNPSSPNLARKQTQTPVQNRSVLPDRQGASLLHLPAIPEDTVSSQVPKISENRSILEQTTKERKFAIDNRGHIRWRLGKKPNTEQKTDDRGAGNSKKDGNKEDEDITNDEGTSRAPSSRHLPQIEGNGVSLGHGAMTSTPPPPYSMLNPFPTPAPGTSAGRFVAPVAPMLPPPLPNRSQSIEVSVPEQNLAGRIIQERSARIAQLASEIEAHSPSVPAPAQATIRAMEHISLLVPCPSGPIHRAGRELGNSSATSLGGIEGNITNLGGEVAPPLHREREFLSASPEDTRIPTSTMENSGMDEMSQGGGNEEHMEPVTNSPSNPPPLPTIQHSIAQYPILTSHKKIKLETEPSASLFKIPNTNPATAFANTNNNRIGDDTAMIKPEPFAEQSEEDTLRLQVTSSASRVAYLRQLMAAQTLARRKQSSPSGTCIGGGRGAVTQKGDQVQGSGRTGQQQQRQKQSQSSSTGVEEAAVVAEARDTERTRERSTRHELKHKASLDRVSDWFGR